MTPPRRTPLIISRLGLSPMKGTRHLELEHLSVDEQGPVDDRRYCLVDPQTLRVLRTVQNPDLLKITVRQVPGGLEITPPGDAEPLRLPATAGGQCLTVDYWGREVSVETLPGPASELFTEHLGREVLLARAPRGEVVYGEQITLLHEPSLAALADRSRLPAEDHLWHRFRPTAVLAASGQSPATRASAARASAARAFEEESWQGRTVDAGSCRLLLGAPVPRCAVIDINPLTGERDGDLLKALGAHRPLNARGEPSFGVFATVLRGGLLSLGDEFAF